MIKFAINTESKTLRHDLGIQHLRFDQSINVRDSGFRLTNLDRPRFGLHAASDLIHFGVEFTSGVATKVLASRIYDKIKGQVTGLQIQGRAVAVDPDEIEKALNEAHVQTDKSKA